MKSLVVQFPKKHKVHLVLRWSVLLFLIISPAILTAEGIGNHQTSFFITVDAESLTRANLALPDEVYLNIHGIPSGINAMMKIADKYHAKITFYFNVYEFSKFGKERIEEIVQFIMQRGHDVELHTDQPLSPGPEKLLNQYSLSEQEKIITKGRDLLYEWTGEYPIAHRAGTYAANDDTLVALMANQIFLDSSYFYKNPHNRFVKNRFNTNAVTVIRSFIEVPVTVFRVNEYTEIAGFQLPRRGRIKKLDIDSCDIEELKAVTSQLVKGKIDTVILFMHSWSFVKRWGNTPDQRMADTRDIKEFEEFLRFIRARPNVRMTSTRDYWNDWTTGHIRLSGNDFIPSLSVKVDLLTYLRRVLGIDRGNYLKWLAGILAVFTLTVAFCLIIYRRIFKRDTSRSRDR